MNNFISRLLILLIAFPLLFLIIFIFPMNVSIGHFSFHHILFNLVIITFALLASFEVERMFTKKKIPTLRFTCPILAATLPLVAYLEDVGCIPMGFFGLWLALIFAVFFSIALFAFKKETLIRRLPLMASATFILFYPSFFLMFMVRMTAKPHPEIVLLFFLAAVFLNDIFAYLAGKLSRGFTRLGLIASPNKTLIGFLAGFIVSIGTVLVLSLLFQDKYILTPFSAIIIGSVVGITSIIGDLFESVLKRSCQIKDSGVMMGGRGGLMDTIDSLLLSAPIFFYLFFTLAQPV
jgi:phosphatidate cytidylyltransferase